MACLLLQTTKPDEVIVVDDHTPDNSVESIFDQYAMVFRSKQIAMRYIRNKRHHSLPVARNTGVKECTGDIVVFMDDDLIPYPTFLRGIMAAFASREVLAVQGFIVNCFGEPSLFRRMFSLLSFLLFRLHERPSKNRFMSHWEYPVFLDRMVHCGYLYGACLAVRRTVFDLGIWFDERLCGRAAGEDRIFSSMLQRVRPDSMFITPLARCLHPNHPYYTKSWTRPEWRREWLYHKYTLLHEQGTLGMSVLCIQKLGYCVIQILRPLLRTGAQNEGERWLKLTEATSERLFRDVGTRIGY